MWNSIKEFGKRYYVLLFASLLICTILFYGCTVGFLDQTVCNLWLRDFLLNLNAEIIGILLVLFLVNRTVRANKENERKKFREIAFRPLKRVFYKQIILLFNMFKASVEVHPCKTYETLEDLFDETYFYELGFLDLLKPAPMLTPRGEEIDWLDYLFTECTSLSVALGKVVDRYSYYLDSEIVDLMEEVADAGFIRFISSIREAKQWHEISIIRGDLLSECQTLLKEYTSSVMKLIDLYNMSVETERQIKIDKNQWREWWGSNVRPRIGDSRIQNAEK
ncbi:hypothetical protein [Microcoleus sp. FACHB-68]|uniref:hypothetical protein n=1 Tax=Microcoleus sp. FACHB-68 TaxID=2692826 RepID=UPI001688B5E4|nr:hypothetical protein [Microcoleus sp. FACHB-68]MBD1940136.1 hypothetical protein [Microcoleus sp. FACHB-68]